MNYTWCNIESSKHIQQLYLVICLYVLLKHNIWKNVFGMNEPSTIFLSILNPLMHNFPKWLDTFLKILQQMLQDF